ncbi:olfactory receptor 5AR1-like [Pleurodeles waltl]|uniref:olfactory receptor 5AR1-like n=1 Tax=Pleurodeles waltl TaxID=8319 RepID=UPI0037095595
MEARNQTLTKEFSLIGLTENPALKVPLFILFSVVYIITVLGNTGIITLIKMAPRLHTPMYFLLGHLSFVDLCYSSAIAPKMLVDMLHKRKRISVSGCVLQIIVYCTCGTMEAFLLTVMAYDRYVAVCQPLHYGTIMTNTYCFWLVTGVYALGIVHSVSETGCTFRLSFCQWEIHHFCCDIPPLLKMSCTDTFINEVVLFICIGFIIFASLFVIIFSYFSIISTIFKMHSSKGRRQVFSTCTPHFTGVTLYFGTSLFTYLRPSSIYSLDQDKVVSLFYTMVIPMLNPWIYSLRNKEVKEALRIVIVKKVTNRIGTY